ncbi:MAG: 16S rRNA (adenine(1518)-N(6)/adenine(1519)-N(6))-dimethyltransferase RsmA [Spirochaetia bacterium]
MNEMISKDPIEYDSPTAIQQFFQQLSIAPRKFLGQNFLINRGVRKKILTLLDLDVQDELWEIGPGIGAMTALALPMVGQLKVFEIDHAYQQILINFFGHHTHFSLVKGDVLKTFKDESVQKTIKVLGNLPYNIAGAIIQEFLKQPMDIAVLLVQKELAQRMNSATRQKSYSSFSVWVQSHFHISTHGIVKPHSFYPVPNVDSMIIKIKPTNLLKKEESALLDRLLRSAFSSRRKTLKNNLLGKNSRLVEYFEASHIHAACRHANMELAHRAEEFTPQQYILCVRYLLGVS